MLLLVPLLLVVAHGQTDASTTTDGCPSYTGAGPGMSDCGSWDGTGDGGIGAPADGVPGVWALGDCARVPNTRSETPDPPTCQHALRQARRLAKNLSGDPKPYGYRMLGQVATLGRYKGIADVVGLRFRGFPGWFITRSYHLYQLPLAQRRTRVVVDWTTSLFFRRDIAELGMLGHPERLE